MDISTIGLDLTKSVFQVHGVGASGVVAARKTLRRSQVLPFFAKLSPCLVGMEACSTSHHWARETRSPMEASTSKRKSTIRGALAVTLR